MKKFFLLKTVVLMAGVVQSGWALSITTTSTDPSSAFFIGPVMSYSFRSGYYDFSETRQSQAVSLNNLTMYGVAAGKRFPLSGLLRLQIGGDFEAGSVLDDTLGTSTSTQIGWSYIHADIEPQLQLVVPTSELSKPYLILGCGLNYDHVTEHTYYTASGEVVEYSDFAYISSGGVNMSFLAGAGFDIFLSKSLSLTASGVYRYWQPVHYNAVQDFPLGQAYHETFQSLVFQLALLFNM